MNKQAKLTFKSGKSDVRAQFAALCYRWFKKKKQARILLVSSRRSGRWVLPKGWPIAGRTPAQSALREAYEEAGVKGTPLDQCMGHYAYTKQMNGKAPVPCIVAVYPVKVEQLLPDYPEFGERERIWLSPAKTAQRIREPALKPILRDFDPRNLIAKPE